MVKRQAMAWLVCCACGMLMAPAQAKVGADKAAELGGPKLSCLGAEKAGTADGVAEYTGKYVGNWPGMKGQFGYEPGPYADEKPLFTITAQNMAQYAAKLTDGQKALLQKYPQGYRMVVYPSHRDFGTPQWVCDVTRQNATTAEVLHDGMGISGTEGGLPFPFPQSGLEAIWNMINPPRPWTESAVTDIADVYASGSITWGRNKFMVLAMSNDARQHGSFQDKLNSYFYSSYLLPQREKGFTAVGYQPNDFSHDATQSWQYLPGIRRVREAPEVGFDYPVPPAGMHTVDDDYGFNGSPERYTWKLIGRKEIYVPYNNFRVNDPAIKYKDLVQPNTINPDYVRYELHRVWVLEGDLKPGVRHIYHRRMLYADEDTWLTVWADNIDARDQLYRVNFVNYHYSQECSCYHRGVSVYHDLSSSSYEAGYMVNEAGDHWWRINQPLSPEQFSPDAAARGGH